MLYRHFFIVALDYTIREVQENQLTVCGDYLNLWGENMNVKTGTEKLN
jgi:hypothetical protein